jgi:pre-mRNA-splicing factor RBM22/SLT11
VQTAPSLKSESIKSVNLVKASNCAFVNFRSRKEAEAAAERCAVKLVLDGQEVRVSWGRSRPKKGGKKAPPSGSTAEAAAA